MPDTTSTTAPNARAAFTAGLNTAATRTALRRVVLAAQNGLPR